MIAHTCCGDDDGEELDEEDDGDGGGRLAVGIEGFYKIKSKA